jgi:fermentation-respiration switch protein FrsA (DUF1100 family)
MSRPVNVAVALVALAVAVVAFFWLTERRLIYFPSTDLPSPAEAGLGDAELVSLSTSDGLRLNAWFLTASEPSPPFTVIVFHGNAGNRAHRAPLALSLRRQGLQVLLVDYRGYAENPGAPSEEGITADAQAALAYLEKRPDVDRSRIVYFGESLGTAVAVRLAVEHPPAALILRSPFTSLVDVGRYHYPFLPVGLLMRDRFATIDISPRLRCPVLVIAGGRDTVVPIEFTRRLYDAIAAPKTFLELPSADHNDYELLAGEEMIRAIAKFLRAA